MVADSGFSGFNEAEAHAPRIRLAAMCSATRKPGFNEAEAHAPRIHASETMSAASFDIASMRPRRMRLGYGLPRQWGSCADMASMRPRRMRLGYHGILDINA